MSVCVSELPLHISGRVRVCVHPLLPSSLSLSLQNKGLSPVIVHRRAPNPSLPDSPLFLPLTSLSVSPTSIQQQLARSYGVTQLPPVFSLFLWPSRFAPAVTSSDTLTQAARKNVTNEAAQQMENTVAQNKLVALQQNSIKYWGQQSMMITEARTAVTEGTAWSGWSWVCLGTWICHISSFAELQCYITREREREAVSLDERLSIADLGFNLFLKQGFSSQGKFTSNAFNSGPQSWNVTKNRAHNTVLMHLDHISNIAGTQF